MLLIDDVTLLRWCGFDCTVDAAAGVVAEKDGCFGCGGGIELFAFAAVLTVPRFFSTCFMTTGELTTP